MVKKQWFAVIDQRQIGPLTSRQLKKLAEEGRVAPTSMVRRDGMKEFVRAEKVNGLFPQRCGGPQDGSEEKVESAELLEQLPAAEQDTFSFLGELEKEAEAAPTSQGAFEITGGNGPSSSILKCVQCGGGMRETTDGMIIYGGPSSLVKLVCDRCDIWRLEQRADVELALATERRRRRWWPFSK